MTPACRQATDERAHPVDDEMFDQGVPFAAECQRRGRDRIEVTARGVHG